MIAFVLGGGGVLGAVEVGMLRALLEAGVTPDLVVGCSVGAINGAAVAAEPSLAGIGALTELWAGIGRGGVFAEGVVRRASTLARSGTHLHSPGPLRHLLQSVAAGRLIQDLPVRFECVAACIETAAPHWFTSGPLADAVLASCAVPGLLPPAKVGGLHYLDGGLVDSIPVGRALALGATQVYVLQVGRVEQPLQPPRRPWQVATVAFELARRHGFHEAMQDLPGDREVVVLPTGGARPATGNVRYRSSRGVVGRMQEAYEATRSELQRRAGQATSP